MKIESWKVYLVISIVLGLFSAYLLLSVFAGKRDAPVTTPAEIESPQSVTEEALLPQAPAPATQTTTTSAVAVNPTPIQTPVPASNDARDERSRPLNQREIESVRTLSNLLRAGLDSRVNHRSLLTQLKSAGLKPEVNSNTNSATGTMTIVRTENSIPGTRYFHAQFFDDAGKAKNPPQHMSFEIRPGADSFEQAIGLVQTMLPPGSKLDGVKKDYRLWRTPDEQSICWVQKLAKEDLKGDPFNARSSADVGTVRVVCEDEIHGATTPDEAH